MELRIQLVAIAASRRAARDRARAWSGESGSSSATRSCGCSARSSLLAAVDLDGAAGERRERDRDRLSASALFVIAFGFVLVLLLHFSVAVSKLADQSKVLAQRLALLEQRQSRLSSTPPPTWRRRLTGVESVVPGQERPRVRTADWCTGQLRHRGGRRHHRPRDGPRLYEARATPPARLHAGARAGGRPAPSSHNSGVIHAGIFPPGTRGRLALRARVTCTRMRRAWDSARALRQGDRRPTRGRARAPPGIGAARAREQVPGLRWLSAARAEEVSHTVAALPHSTRRPPGSWTLPRWPGPMRTICAAPAWP